MMRLRTTRLALSDWVSLLNNEGVTFATATFRVTDTPDDVIDQLEWLLRAAREHVEGIE
jgi:hypothetical protein